MNKAIILLKFFFSIVLLLLFIFLLIQFFINISANKYFYIFIPFIILFYLGLGYGFWNKDLENEDNFAGRILLLKALVWPGYFIIQSCKNLRFLFKRNK